jgi:tagaturonate reductase
MKNVRETVDKVFGAYPERVLQFGEGNFLRAFADWMINKANARGLFKGSIVLCQPIREGKAREINAQNGVYTLVMRGREQGEAREDIEVVTSVSRCLNPYEDYDALLKVAANPDLQVIISNTTEAGIAYHAGDRPTDRPPFSFPAKLAAFLHERFRAFQGASSAGLLVLPVELIEDNGGNLRRIVRRYAEEWHLGPDFLRWLDNDVRIASTLVDRIVTGYPRDEIERFTEKLGYRDDLLVTSELFNLWVIEGDPAWADILPIHETDAHVIWTRDVSPYKVRKVRILNGGHTSTVLAAYLAGYDIVLDFMRDDLFRAYLHRLLFDEIMPTLDLPRADLEEFAGAVADRFDNPYIKHKLLDIALNSCAKFCARSLPSLLGYIERKKTVPPLLSFSFAAFIAFYKGRMENGAYVGRRADGTSYVIRDDAEVLEFFAARWARGTPATVAGDVLAGTAFWGGRDLTDVPGLLPAVAGHLERIERSGDIREVMAALLEQPPALPISS